MAWKDYIWVNKVSKATAERFNNIELGIEESVRGLHHTEDAKFNVSIGSTLPALTTGEYNAAYGAGALNSITSGNLNTASGAGALGNLTTGIENVVSGLNAGRNLTTGRINVAIGSEALRIATTAEQDIAIGRGALLAATGSFNIGIGTFALRNASTVEGYNIGIGPTALEALTTGEKNVAIGGANLLLLTTGKENAAFGYNAMELAAATVNQNAAMGSFALWKATGSQNAALGNGAGAEFASGGVALGFEAGRNEKGSNRLYIANTNTATPLILGTFPNALLQFNVTEMGFFSHAVGKLPEVTGATVTAKQLAEAFAGIGLVKVN